MRPATPNHALQRTATAVTACAADRRHLSTHRHRPRQPPPSLSLRSLGVIQRLPRFDENHPTRHTRRSGAVSMSSEVIQGRSFPLSEASEPSRERSFVSPKRLETLREVRFTLPKPPKGTKHVFVAFQKLPAGNKTFSLPSRRHQQQTRRRFSPISREPQRLRLRFGPRLPQHFCASFISMPSLTDSLFGVVAESLSRSEMTPNHALQRTGAAVTPAASCLRLSPTTQRSRQPRPSLSLGSLGVLCPLFRE